MGPLEGDARFAEGIIHGGIDHGCAAEDGGGNGAPSEADLVVIGRAGGG